MRRVIAPPQKTARRYRRQTSDGLPLKFEWQIYDPARMGGFSLQKELEIWVRAAAAWTWSSYFSDVFKSEGTIFIVI